MELARRRFEADPGSFTQSVRANRRRTLTGPAARPGDADTTSHYFTKEVPFNKAKSAAYLVFGLIHIFDLMEANRWVESEAVAALLLCAAEQAALREWRWTSAWLLTHLPEPPWTSIRQTPARGQIRPMSRLASPEWVAAAIAYTKDTLALEDAERKLAPTSAPKAEESGAKGENKQRRGKASGAPPHE